MMSLPGKTHHDKELSLTIELQGLVHGRLPQVKNLRKPYILISATMLSQENE
jgi:hypothetical protein